MQPEDRKHVVVDMNRVNLTRDATRQGVSFATLFEDDHETVRKERWTAGASVRLDTTGGAELLVLSGTLRDGETELTARDWLRAPDGDARMLVAGADGAEIWIKTGHIAHVRVPEVA